MNQLSRLVVFLLGACLLSAVPREARALEIAGTASFGAFQVGTTTRFAVAPGLALRLGPVEGFNLTLQDSFVVFPSPGPFGFDNRASLGVGSGRGASIVHR